MTGGLEELSILNEVATQTQEQLSVQQVEFFEKIKRGETSLGNRVLDYIATTYRITDEEKLKKRAEPLQRIEDALKDKNGEPILITLNTYKNRTEGCVRGPDIRHIKGLGILQAENLEFNLETGEITIPTDGYMTVENGKDLWEESKGNLPLTSKERTSLLDKASIYVNDITELPLEINKSLEFPLTHSTYAWINIGHENIEPGFFDKKNGYGDFFYEQAIHNIGGNVSVDYARAVTAMIQNEHEKMLRTLLPFAMNTPELKKEDIDMIKLCIYKAKTYNFNEFIEPTTIGTGLPLMHAVSVLEGLKETYKEQLAENRNN